MKLPIFKLEKYFAKYEFNAPYLLCSSDNESLSLKELLKFADEESLELWENLRLGYTQVPGLPLLRKEIGKLYKNIGERNVGTFAGAEEAIFAAMQVILRPGDHVIVPTPCYQSLSTLPKELGAEVSLLPMKERGGNWTLDVEELGKLVKPEYTPHRNQLPLTIRRAPTSTALPLESIVECAKSVSAYLFSDEVYRFSEHRPGLFSTPAAADLYDKALSLGVMSKTFGFAGMRVGWLATQDTELLEACLDTNVTSRFATARRARSWPSWRSGQKSRSSSGTSTSSGKTSTCSTSFLPNTRRSSPGKGRLPAQLPSLSSWPRFPLASLPKISSRKRVSCSSPARSTTSPATISASALAERICPRRSPALSGS